jgi:SAM-dependent methyltransferase
MARLLTDQHDPHKPRIEPDKVRSFFEERARRIPQLGPLRAVLYQDNHPDLAERRDAAEKLVLGPLLAVDQATRFLDIGCGTGRWVSAVAGGCAHYHGFDLSPGLIAFARTVHADRLNCRFSVCSAVDLSLSALDETEPFDRIMAAGVFLYLNDEEVELTMQRIADVAAKRCRLVIREPMAVVDRLTIREHYSEDLNQTYNAIYRTEAELLQLASNGPLGGGFRRVDSADLFLDQSLNNRPETRQRWLVLERAE